MSRPATFPQVLIKRAKLQFPQDVAKVEVLGHPNNMALSVGKMLGQKEVIEWMEGVNAVQIPYRGGAPAMLATIKGEAQFTLMSSSLAAPQVEAGKLRALAIGGAQRDPQLPDVPTFKEAGFPDVQAVTWAGIFAPAGTPAAIVKRLNSEIDRIIHEPDVAAKLKQHGFVISGGSPDVLGRLVSEDIARWTAVAQKSHIMVKH